MSQRERFAAWFSRYHDEACDQYGGLDCTNPKGIAEDVWQEAERQMIERCAKVCEAVIKNAGFATSARECLEAIRELGSEQ